MKDVKYTTKRTHIIDILTVKLIQNMNHRIICVLII